MTHPAGVSAGGSGAEHLLALDEDDIGDAEAGEVIGDARAHASAADDHDVSGAFHVAHADRVQGSWFRVLGSFSFRVLGSEFRVLSAGFRVRGSGTTHAHRSVHGRTTLSRTGLLAAIE